VLLLRRAEAPDPGLDHRVGLLRDGAGQQRGRGRGLLLLAYLRLRPGRQPGQPGQPRHQRGRLDHHDRHLLRRHGGRGGRGAGAGQGHPLLRRAGVELHLHPGRRAGQRAGPGAITWARLARRLAQPARELPQAGHMSSAAFSTYSEDEAPVRIFGSTSKSEVPADFVEALKDLYESIMRGPRERYDARSTNPTLIGHDSRDLLAPAQIFMLGVANWGVYRHPLSVDDRVAVLERSLAWERWPVELIDENEARVRLQLPGGVRTSDQANLHDLTEYVGRVMPTTVALTAFALSHPKPGLRPWRNRVDEAMVQYSRKLAPKLRRRGTLA
jgi:hypothetical protein